MDQAIRTDAVKLAKLGKLLSNAAVVIESLEASEIQVAQLKQGIIDLGGIKKNLEADIEAAKVALQTAKDETKATVEAAKVNSDGVLASATKEAEKLLGEAKEALEAAQARAAQVEESAAKRDAAINVAIAGKTKELTELQAKIDKIKAAAKTFAGV